MRARKTRSAAASTTSGDRNGRDRQGSARTDRVGRPQTSKPAGHRPAPPPEASPAVVRALRLLELVEESAQRLIRRLRARRGVLIGGPSRVGSAWNERDIDLRITSGDPIGITDAIRDHIENATEAVERLEMDMGIR
jgi:hypothetical protein